MLLVLCLFAGLMPFGCGGSGATVDDDLLDSLSQLLITFSPEQGMYNADIDVTISSANDVTIYYTTDETTPDQTTTKYITPISVMGHGTETTIKAIAYDTNNNVSDIATATYTINYETVATPVFSPDAGTYINPFEISITTNTADATIHYTVDATTPDCSATEYTAPLTINTFDTTTTLKAIACKEGMATSDSATAVYTLDTAWTNISSYNYINCGVRTDGTLWCWGYDKYDYIHTTGESIIIEPLQIGTDSNWNDLSVGYEHICALKTNNDLYCWGQNDKGQLGINSIVFQNSPQQVDGSWKKFSAGYHHTCGIKTDDTLWCWGKNDKGEIGDNSIIQRNAPTQSGTSTWSEIAAGSSFTCGIKSDKTLWCWGNNGDYQLGNGTTSNELLAFNTSTQSFKSLVSGHDHTCAIKTNGTLWCWGLNDEGEVGNNDSGTPVETPLQIGSATNWTSLTAEEKHTCATTSDGNGYCWGYNDDAQLGTGDMETYLVPTEINATGWTQLSAGSEHSCGIKENGQLYCWGNNRNGQLGNGETIYETSPIQEVTKSITWTSVTASSSHTCAKKSDGSLWCWGNGQYGQLGVGYSTGYESLATPTNITDPTGTWLDISSYYKHTCAIKNDDSVYCWGFGPQGQIGDGLSNNYTYSPTHVSGSLSYQDIDTGEYFSCAITTSNELYCWGNNSNGQLGLNSTTSFDIPKISFTPTSWSSLGLGETHACGIMTNNDLYCWGNNQEGQVGDLTSGNNKLAPVHVGTTVDYTMVSAGSNHTCAVSLLPSPNYLQCWGVNDYGELGLTVPSTTGPMSVNVDGNYNIWESVDLGNEHTCAIQTDNTLWCWGYNINGELGDGTKTNKDVPTQEISAASNWNVVSAGEKHTCAIKTDGTLWCWGYNHQGQLGNGTYGKKTSPVNVIEP